MNRAAAPLPHLLLPVLLVAATLVVGAPAHALDGTRYASPAGTSAQDCLSLATACNIEKAINDSEYGDEVILSSGTYTTSTDLQSADAVVVRAADPADPPVINTSAAYGLWVGAGAGGGARDLRINHTGSVAAFIHGGPGTSQRIVARSSAVAASACGGPYGTAAGGLLRDSLCVATGSSGTGVAYFLGAGAVTYDVGLTNVTAIATGTNGVGVQVDVNGAGLVVDYALRNVIAIGAKDIRTATADGATLAVTATHSRYATVDTAGGGTVTAAGSGTNLTAAPVFADTTDYRPTAASPTIDKGAGGPTLGSTDLDGRARLIGSAPDMGAYELPDTRAPQTTLTKKPKKKTFSRTARFRFTSDERGSTFRCQLDKRPVRICTSPYKKKKLKPGKHVFRVWAVDAAGNQDRTAARWTWKVKKRR